MITKEILLKEYIEEEKPMHEVAKDLGVSVGTVFNYLKKYEIETRPRMTEKTKAKISDALIGKPSSLKGKPKPNEWRENLSKAKKGQILKPSKYGGHRKRRKDGYIAVFCPHHPMKTKEGYVMEHILVMEEHIGRYVTRDEVVHHKNHIRDDNRLENLELMTFKEHAGLHMKERWDKRRNNL